MLNIINQTYAKTTSYSILNNAGEQIGSSQQNLDRIQDNPSKDFGTSFLSTYAWLRGVYPQDATWNFWAVQALTLIGSLFLITIVQNIFIAFIWGVYTEAYEKGRVALLRFRADLISDYEALDDVHFSPVPLEPKYIYYLGKSKSYNAWEKAVKEREEKNEKLYDDYEKKMNKIKLSFKEKKDDDSFWNYNVSNDMDIIRDDASSKSKESVNTIISDDYDYDDDDENDDDDDENSYTKFKSINDKINELLKNIKKY
ncbi:hypothetical protein C1645_818568 [Glomus cerebriforme]|uniref:Ion transport domain-containing protein n=1 Tax=Glomus cerebriforme TaxID=658196 RepID=A0A397TCR7_9GLOM|nr:hypothetical protein C1645_818568 [Glomus cerebriforme]